jgi:hypothetical protein
MSIRRCSGNAIKGHLSTRQWLSSARIGLLGGLQAQSETRAVTARFGRRGEAGCLMFPVANGVALHYPPVATELTAPNIVLSRIVVLIPIIFVPLFFEMSAMLLAGLWFLFRALGAVTNWSAPFAGGGIAWWAHIGGFIAGAILAAPLRPVCRRQWPRDVDKGIPGFAPPGICLRLINKTGRGS